MSLLLLPPRFTPDSIALYGAAVELGWQVERLQSWRVPSHLEGKVGAIYGEPLFGAAVADQLSLSLFEPSVSWLAELPNEFRLREVAFTTLGEAKRIDKRAFIKPAGDKSFPAKVYDAGESLPSTDFLSDETPILVSEVVSWSVEFRCFILNGEVKTLSAYARNGEVNQSEDGSWMASSVEMDQAFEYCSSAVNSVGESLPPSVVVDVGEIEGRGWAVVEANPSWSSGIYGCDPKSVLDVIMRACARTETLTTTEHRWVIKRNEV